MRTVPKELAIRKYEFKDKTTKWILEGNHLAEMNNKQLAARQKDEVPPVNLRLSLEPSTCLLLLSIENPLRAVCTVDLEQPFQRGFEIAKQTIASYIGSMTGETEQPDFKKFRVIDLEEGEGFTRSFDIHELAIWPEIQAAFIKDTQNSIELTSEVRCWINDKEFVYSTRISIDKHAFQKINETATRKLQ